eukprot:CAMPEP_0172501246 /NCGR_PEP_ID=MMETSP1066-20121228/147664_1 /TAXON_ID=671091 /ORGANISM="Coscinodiscus wailesii, Strain CCMP2513" /LENGTH=735 /DNA_ID=CAMNT_0013275917 /DNA_START=157 /DNA_END=2364 /DNA_ORIENTATION=+
MLHPRKHHVRAIFRVFALLTLVIGYGSYNYVTKQRAIENDNPTVVDSRFDAVVTTTSSVPHHPSTSYYDETTSASTPTQQRRAEVSCDALEVANPTWMIVFYIIGVLYTFLALAIVCDEFFVPALEEMSSERHLNLTMDVAGATLMAAGGSAPELFTSLVGTFQESAIGFGTIVGSAVFNVLFVIAMCSFLSKEVLKLTWWPLARDCSYYVFGLAILAIFVGKVSPGLVTWWESLILFGLYFGYVLLMKYNRALYTLITGKVYVDPGEEETSGDSVKTGDSIEPTFIDSDRDPKTESNLDPVQNGQISLDPDLVQNGQISLEESMRMAAQAAAATTKTRVNYTHGRWPGTFRAGIVKLITYPEAWRETASLGIVAQIAGDVDATFRQIDGNGDGYIDRTELKLVFRELGTAMTPEEYEQAFNELDKNQDGKITEQEFTEYYIRSQGQIQKKMSSVFKKFDKDGNGSIDRKELKALLESIEPSTTDKDIDQAMKELDSDQNEIITFDEFSEWYSKSILFERRMDDVKSNMQGTFDHLKPPAEGSCIQYLVYIIYLPILSTLTFTVPDVRKPGWSKYCYVAFLLSIIWIGGYSYLMVWWATVIGNTVGIPDVVMGLTFIAAGTSVPDLLSSVIVARRGEGDMAVSSSIGSNIFDILVGLPVPWLLFSIIRAKPVTVGADGVDISIYILLGMVAAVILTIHFCGWKLNRKVGAVMLLLYGVFLAQAIYRSYPFKLCEP